MPIEYRETHEDLQTRIDIHTQYGGRDIDAWMLDLLQPEKGSRILDVGCGAGKQLAAFHRHLEGNAHIEGGDISQELLEQAQALSTELGDAFRITELDFNRPFQFEADQFDLVSCCFALYYAEDIPFTVGEVHRVLRPGGRLFTTGPMPENKQLFYDVIRSATDAEIPPMPGSSRYASEIFDAIHSGFASAELEIFENPLTFDKLGPFIDYVRASLSEDRKLWKGLFESAGEFDSVMERITNEAEDRLNQEGRLIMTKVVGGIVATK
jgi:ubiquinone/menaquinone biosynthesis C-methylase UbiE